MGSKSTFFGDVFPEALTTAAERAFGKSLFLYGDAESGARRLRFRYESNALG
jgi:hypothetical protein